MVVPTDEDARGEQQPPSSRFPSDYCDSLPSSPATTRYEETGFPGGGTAASTASFRAANGGAACGGAGGSAGAGGAGAGAGGGGSGRGGQSSPAPSNKAQLVVPLQHYVRVLGGIGESVARLHQMMADSEFQQRYLAVHYVDWQESILWRRVNAWRLQVSE